MIKSILVKAGVYFSYKKENKMALSFGNKTVIKTSSQARKIHESVARGKRLDTSKLNYSLKKSVSELLESKDH